MRILVISDIHGNLPAFEAVLEHAGLVDAVWCLGDLVGYGPQPNECVDLVRTLPNLICLLGNHDAASMGGIDLEEFNNEARQSVQYMIDNLTEDNKAFLERLPEKIRQNSYTMAHGSPRYPIWEYILNTEDARHNMPAFTTKYCLVGHTHVPVVYKLEKKDQHVEMTIPQAGQVIKLTSRMILNPGSVGQPRDHNSNASYAIIDSSIPSWELHRVPYNFRLVQKLIVDAGLPVRNAARLEGGW